MMSNYDNPLPGVPLVESPFFAQSFAAGLIDDETMRIAKELNERGFAVFDFPDPDTDLIAERVKQALNDRYDWEMWRGGGDNLRLQDAWHWNSDVHRIAANEQVLSLLSTLYGRQAFPFQTLNFPAGTQQHYHSDSIHFSSMPERFMCGVWLALEDIGPDQGPLIYYPGSHKWPIYTNEQIGYSHVENLNTNQSIYHSLWQRLIEANGVKPERFYARKGQALIWAANLLHGGDIHLDRGQTRWSQVTHYYFEGCSYYTPMATDAPFGGVKYRKPIDVRTGKQVLNIYNGRQVPAAQLEAADPKRMAQQWAAAPFADGSVSSLLTDFDPDQYLLANPDVAASGMPPQTHYLRHGLAEGRPLRP